MKKLGFLSDLMIPVVLLLILAIMLLPMPIFLMDVFIIGNLVSSLLILLLTVFLVKPLSFSSFPTLILFTTMFRLAINVSSTRMILNKATAGETVKVFGSLVIDNNLAVGVMVFIIITIVQFLVIAKGSERIAEVSARFALDAMPGRQMSLDGDFRAGVISMEELKSKRYELQMESKFFGALDGAMKFVKGDTIAGLLITAINCIGGLMIGIFVHRLPALEALSVYTMLTVGDGLLSQIPALLNSLAAGIVVTRVNEEDNTSFASELPRQLSRFRFLMLGSLVLSIGFTFVFGYAALIFAFISLFFLLFQLVALYSGFSQVEDKSEHSLDLSGVTFYEDFRPKHPKLVDLILTQPLSMSRSELVGISANLQNQLYEQTGALIPNLMVDFKREDASRLEVFFRGERVKRFEFASDDIAENITLASNFLADHIAELVDDEMTMVIVGVAKDSMPYLLEQLIPEQISITKLTMVVREILAQRLCIKNLAGFFQGVAEGLNKEPHSQEVVPCLSEEIRMFLRYSLINDLKRRQQNAKLETVGDESIDGEFEDSVMVMLLPPRLVGVILAENEMVWLQILEQIIQELVSLSNELPILVPRAIRYRLDHALRGRGLRNQVVAIEELEGVGIYTVHELGKSIEVGI